MIYEHGKPWLNDDAGRGKVLTRPPELFGNPISRIFWEQAGGREERSENFTL
jgi:hypothetical protein